MKKALRIPRFYVMENYPFDGDYALSDPDDEDTLNDITYEQFQEMQHLAELLKKTCVKHYTSVKYPDGMFTEDTQWWFDLEDTGDFENEVFSAKNLEVHPLIKLIGVLNFNVPLHGRLANVISGGKYEAVTLNNVRQFLDEFSQETAIFG